MNAKISIEDSNENSVINILDIKSKNDFYYEENSSCKSHINIYNNGVVIDRQDIDHNSYIHLIDKDSYIKIQDKNGEIKLDIKIIEKSINNDIVVIVYQIEDITKKITIKFY